MSSEVKRYEPDVSRRGDAYMDAKPDGDYVHHDDYAALEAECARLKNSLLAVTARHFAEGWKKRTSDAELEQYLSAGIAQLEAKRDKLAGLLDRVITEVGRTITSELRDDIDAALAEVER